MWRFSPPQLEVVGMRKFFGGMVLAALALSLPAAARAQRRAAAPMGGAKHEFGVDVGVAYVSSNITGVDGGIAIVTPLDVRFGFVPRAGNKIMWEPRASLNFTTVGGSTTYLFTPQINMLYANSTGGHRRGMYFTGGAGLVMGDGGAGSGTALKLEGGIGWRKPYESAAWRYEVGVQWVSSSAELGTFADYIAIGGRIGLSLWH
jgi:hypothetical protein